MTELDPTSEPMQSTSTPALTTSLAPSRARSRFVRYIIGHGWMHLLLLTSVGIFLFPFVYMFGTSMKTDEELTDASWFPAIPHFAPASPRVRPAAEPARPFEASPEKWAAVLPQIRQIARAAIEQAKLPAGGDAVDANEYRAQTAEYLVARLVSRLNPDLWSGDVSKYVAAFKIALTGDTISTALDDRLSRLELRGLQVRSLDSHIFNITAGRDIKDHWTIRTGGASQAQFISTDDAAILRYKFPSASAPPIELHCNFEFPCDPANFHKLMLALRADDSWNQISATLTVGRQRWQSQEVKYLGTNRNFSLIYQPPTFDDTTDRKRIWIPLQLAGAVDGEAASSSVAHSQPSDAHGIA